MTIPEPNFSPEYSLTPPQHRVINMIVEGSTISAAAAAIGIHRNTIRNWRRSVPEFARELDLAAREQALYWHEQAVMLAPKSIEILRTILHNDSASLSLKLRAATTILKMAAEPKTPMHKHAQPGVAEIQALPAELLTMQHHMAESIAHNRAQSAQSAAPQTIRKSPEPSRNSLCPCNSGQKYKRCCAVHTFAQNAA